MPVALRDYVLIRIRGEVNTVPGVVVSSGAKGVEIATRDGRLIGPLSPSHRAIQSIAAPLPEDLAQIYDRATRKWKKGDAVLVEYEGRSLRGRVERGGTSSVSVIALDPDHPGVEIMLRCPGSMLTEAAPFEIAPVSAPMNRWGITSYREHKELSEETRAVSGKITLDGKPVLAFRNDGRGGCNFYDRLPGGKPPLPYEDMMLVDLIQWHRDLGIAHSVFEPLDCWIEWMQHDRLLGIDERAWAEQEIARHAEFAAPAPGMP